MTWNIRFSRWIFSGYIHRKDSFTPIFIDFFMLHVWFSNKSEILHWHSQNSTISNRSIRYDCGEVVLMLNVSWVTAILWWTFQSTWSLEFGQRNDRCLKTHLVVFLLQNMWGLVASLSSPTWKLGEKKRSFFWGVGEDVLVGDHVSFKNCSGTFPNCIDFMKVNNCEQFSSAKIHSNRSNPWM